MSELQQGDIQVYNAVTEIFENFHFMETADRIINFDNSMSAAEIQTKIDSIGKFIDDHVIIFQFADGMYDLATTLNFNGFYGSGGIILQGNVNEANANALHMTQEVYLHGDFNGYTMNLSCNACSVLIRNFRVSTRSNLSVHDACINVNGNASLGLVYNYLFGSTYINGCGLYVCHGFATARMNYVANIKYGFLANGATHLLSSQNASNSGNKPAYGLAAAASGTIGREGSQPTGRTSSVYTTSGGIIR